MKKISDICLKFLIIKKYFTFTIGKLKFVGNNYI